MFLGYDQYHVYLVAYTKNIATDTEQYKGYILGTAW